MTDAEIPQAVIIAELKAWAMISKINQTGSSGPPAHFLAMTTRSFVITTHMLSPSAFTVCFYDVGSTV